MGGERETREEQNEQSVKDKGEKKEKKKEEGRKKKEKNEAMEKAETAWPLPCPIPVACTTLPSPSWTCSASWHLTRCDKAGEGSRVGSSEGTSRQ